MKFLCLRSSAVAIGLTLAGCLLDASSFIILPVLLLLRLVLDRLACLACPLIASLGAGRREAGLWLAALVVMYSLLGCVIAGWAELGGKEMLMVGQQLRAVELLLLPLG